MNQADENPDAYNLSLARAIVLLRSEKEISREVLAERSGIESLRLKQIEKGTASITIEEIAKLASVIACDAARVIEIADFIHTQWRGKSGQNLK